MIIKLLQLYRNIFRTLAYLVPALDSKPFQISTMMRHTGTLAQSEQFTQPFSGKFRDIQQHSSVFKELLCNPLHIQLYHIQDLGKCRT